VVGLILLTAAAQATDLLTFAPTVARYGSGGEANPVMAAAYSHFGLWGAAGLKGLMLLLALLVVYAIDGAGGPQWVGVAILILAGVAGLIGAYTNLWALSL